MKLSPQFKMDVEKVIVITIFYIAISVFMAFNNNTMISFSGTQPVAVDGISAQFNIIVNFFVGLFAGIVGGSLFVFVNSKLFRKKSFRFGLISTLISYIAVFVAIVVGISIATGYQTGSIEFSNWDSVKNEVWNSLSSPLSLVNFVFWGFISLFTLFMLQVNDKFGPGILRKFIMGKYTQPMLEERIFMFLDMKSSTTIAEKIGTKEYFNLLRDCFSDVTEPIIEYEGEIYQYVGDEVVVSWTTENGFKNANCLKCFDAIQRKLTSRKDYYTKKYGVMPGFKAGLHYGMVTAGEIGDIKKDIVYSGDVLNTTARIQSLCNQYETDFIASEITISNIEVNDFFKSQYIGSVELKGRKEKVELNSIRMNASLN